MSPIVEQTAFLRRRRHPQPPPAAPAAIGQGSDPAQAPDSAAPQPSTPGGEVSLPGALRLTGDAAPVAEAQERRRRRARVHDSRRSVLSTLPELPRGQRVAMDPVQAPVMVLGRLRSGVGVLSVGFAAGTPEGMSLGCVYEDVEGRVSVAERSAVISPGQLVMHTGTGAIVVNLRQVRRLSRFLIFATRMHTGPWAGAIIGSAGGTESLLMPLASEAPSTTRSLLTGHTVDGQLVLRAEADHLDGPLRTLCENHGYELAWVTPDTPLT